MAEQRYEFFRKNSRVADTSTLVEIPSPPTISSYMKRSVSENLALYVCAILLAVGTAGNNIVGPYFLSTGFAKLETEDSAEGYLPYMLSYVLSWIVGRVLLALTEEVLVPVGTSFSHALANDAMEAYFALPMENTTSSAGSEAVHHFGISYEQIGPSFIRGLYGKIVPAALDLVGAIAFTSAVFGTTGGIVAAAVAAHLVAVGAGLGVVSRAQNGYVLGLFRAYEFIIGQVDQYENTHYFEAVERELNKLSTTLTVLDENLDKSLLVRARAIFLQSRVLLGVTLFCSGLFYTSGLAKKMTSNYFIWYLFYLIQISPTFQKLGEAINKLYGDYGTFNTLVNYLNQAYSNISFGQKELELSPEEATITFEDISFTYPTSTKPVLEKFSLHIPAGKTVVITGSSGGGKSTLFRLLQRFYKQQSGHIRLGEDDISEVDIESLREVMAIVPQSPTLQNTSIYENIRYANPQATDDEIHKAAELAGLTALIHQKGFDFIVGANGAKLSGGQRQRVAIARAYLRKDARILLMDEPTSALDAQTEKDIVVELGKLLTSRPQTTLFISHRLGILHYLKDHIHHIIYLDQGHILEAGTLDELIERDGLFAAQMRIAEEEASIGVSHNLHLRGSSEDDDERHVINRGFSSSAT